MTDIGNDEVVGLRNFSREPHDTGGDCKLHLPHLQNSTSPSHLSPTFINIFAANQLISSIVTMTQQMKKEVENPGKHHDDDGIFDDDDAKNGLEDDEYFDGFHNNEDVTSKADQTYMGVLNKLTRSGKDVTQFLMGEDWDRDPDKDDGK